MLAGVVDAAVAQHHADRALEVQAGAHRPDGQAVQRDVAARLQVDAGGQPAAGHRVARRARVGHPGIQGLGAGVVEPLTGGVQHPQLAQQVVAPAGLQGVGGGGRQAELGAGHCAQAALLDGPGVAADAHLGAGAQHRAGRQGQVGAGKQVAAGGPVVDQHGVGVGRHAQVDGVGVAAVVAAVRMVSQRHVAGRTEHLRGHTRQGGLVDIAAVQRPLRRSDAGGAVDQRFGRTSCGVGHHSDRVAIDARCGQGQRLVPLAAADQAQAVAGGQTGGLEPGQAAPGPDRAGRRGRCQAVVGITAQAAVKVVDRARHGSSSGSGSRRCIGSTQTAGRSGQLVGRGRAGVCLVGVGR